MTTEAPSCGGPCIWVPLFIVSVALAGPVGLAAPPLLYLFALFFIKLREAHGEIEANAKAKKDDS